ncbi:MAG: ThiF family adenylyltransferase [Planctomycetota bacterium]|nr:ThiF family adenylyltransferase [Planctomycetota bacterium]
MKPVPRHHRQTLLRGIGPSGQEALSSSHVMVVGCGALGSFAIDQLARAGVGMLTLVDRDVVELTNLQRQTLYVESHVRDGVPKAEAAADRVRAIDSSLKVYPVVEHFDSNNAVELLGRVDLVIDGLDNFPSRFLLNDACVSQEIPWIHGGAVGETGTSMTILPGKTPCLRCLFPDPPAPGLTPTCDTAGVFAPIVATVASHQVSEAMKFLVGQHQALDHALVSWDLWRNRSNRLPLADARRPDCPCCRHARYEFLDSTVPSAISLCGRDAVQIIPEVTGSRLDLEILVDRLQPHGDFRIVSGLLKGTLSEDAGDGRSIELTVFPDGRAIVGGGSPPDQARGIYARYIGH